MRPIIAIPDTDHNATLSARLEEQPDSPLFARLADGYLHAGMPASALGILREGMEFHPTYASGYLVAARALIMMRHYTEAMSMLQQASLLQPDCLAALKLKESIPQLEQSHPPDTRSLPQNESTAALQPSATHRVKNERFSRQQDLIAGSDVLFGLPQPAPLEPTPTGNATIELLLSEPSLFASLRAEEEEDATELERLARVLEGARMPALDANDVFLDEREDIPAPSDVVDVHARPVTETLAEIYVRQGRIEEAIETFLTLCVRHPERREKFIARIADLQQASQGTPPSVD